MKLRALKYHKGEQTKLSNLKKGQKAKVVFLNTEDKAVRRRLLDMGITEGVQVKIKKMITYFEEKEILDSIKVDSISNDTTFFRHKEKEEQKRIFDQSFYFMFDIENNQLINPSIYAVSKVGTKPELKPLKDDDLWWVSLPKEWKDYFVNKLKMPEFPDKYDFAKLDYLNKIDLTKETFTDITPLAKVTGLKMLLLQNTQISSLI